MRMDRGMVEGYARTLGNAATQTWDQLEQLPAGAELGPAASQVSRIVREIGDAMHSGAGLADSAAGHLSAVLADVTATDEGVASRFTREGR